MTSLSHLFSENKDTPELIRTKTRIEKNIDEVLAKGTCNTEVLEIMKNLLQELSINTSITDYIDDIK